MSSKWWVGLIAAASVVFVVGCFVKPPFALLAFFIMSLAALGWRLSGGREPKCIKCGHYVRLHLRMPISGPPHHDGYRHCCYIIERDPAGRIAKNCTCKLAEGEQELPA